MGGGVPRRDGGPPVPAGATTEDEARASSAAAVRRLGLPSVDPPPLADAAAADPATPARADAQSLAEELLRAIEDNDYDAFVAKGSPSFRVALGPDRLKAVNAALGGRLSTGHHVSTLGHVRRRRTIDWIFKIEFDDDDGDLLCTLAMDGWQVAGFLVTRAIPQLSENHHHD